MWQEFETLQAVPLLNPSKIAITGLDLAIAAQPGQQDDTPGTIADQVQASKKKKGKATRGLEILENADLKLESGTRYGLIGRNGSGKSSV